MALYEHLVDNGKIIDDQWQQCLTARLPVGHCPRCHQPTYGEPIDHDKHTGLRTATITCTRGHTLVMPRAECRHTISGRQQRDTTTAERRQTE